MGRLDHPNIKAARNLELKLFHLINTYENTYGTTVMNVSVLKEDGDDPTSFSTGISILASVPMFGGIDVPTTGIQE